MGTARLEAFSDGVLAIIITIMVLELKVPTGENFSALRPLLPVFLCYVLSFIYVGIYWNSHHHLFQATKKIRGTVLWANLHLLFWLSMFPFTTGWMGLNHFAKLPTAVYGFVLMMAAIAYWILERAIISVEGECSHLARAVGKDFKANLSIFLYIVAIPIAFLYSSISQLIYALVAAMWLVPDRRIEHILDANEQEKLR